MKIGFFITARLKSTRLKEKILLDLNGKTIIDRVIERCKSVKGINAEDVVLCTSFNSQDAQLYDYALKNGIKFYIGSENDVLLRLGKAAEYYGFDYFLSITADNPLFSREVANWIYDIINEERPDFVFSKGLPVGCNLYALSQNCTKIVNFIKSEEDTEIWGPLVNQPDIFKVIELEISNSPFNEDYRLTVDYPEDFELLSKVFSYYEPSFLPEAFDVIKLLKNEPKLWEMNSLVKQKYLTDEEIKKIRERMIASTPLIQKYSVEKNIHIQPGFIQKVESYD